MNRNPLKLTMLQSHQLFDYLIQNKEKLTLFSDRQISDLATKALGFAVTEAHVFTRRESAGVARERYIKHAPKDEASIDTVAGFSALLSVLEKTGFVSAAESAVVMEELQGKGR